MSDDPVHTKKPSKVLKVAKFIFHPGRPLPLGTGDIFRKIKKASSLDAKMVEAGKKQLAKNGNVVFQDYLEHYKITDEDLILKMAHHSRWSKFFFAACVFFFLVTILFKINGIGLVYVSVALILSLIMYLRFALNSLRVMQMKYRQLLGFAEWFSNPSEWF